MIEVQVFRTTGAHTIIHEACTVHLQGTPVPQEDLSALTQNMYLCHVQISIVSVSA